MTRRMEYAVISTYTDDPTDRILAAYSTESEAEHVRRALARIPVSPCSVLGTASYRVALVARADHVT